MTLASEQLLVRLNMDSRQYKKSAREASIATGTIGKSADASRGRVDKMRAGFRKIGPAASIAGLAATAAIGKFTADSIRDASNLQESINAINVVFGDSADEIHALGEESAESFGLSRRAFNEFATRFSAFGREISEGTGRDVVEIVDEITGRVADFASVHNLSMERAAEVTQSTLAGETEVFRRFGGDVSAATVEMRLLEEGIIDQGEAASEQEKILGRYLEFMDQTAVTAGDFANTSDDLANKQRIFSAELEDTRAEIGEDLLPVMTDLLDVGQDLIPVLVTIGEVVGIIGRGLAIALAGSDVERFGIQVGVAVDNAEGLATAIVELEGAAGTAAEIRNLPKRIREFIDEAELAPDAIRTVIDNMDFLVETMGLSEDAAGEIAEVLREELAESMYETRDAAMAARPEVKRVGDGLTDAEQAARDFFNTSQDLGGELGDQGGAWDDVITSMENYETMLRRLTDPVFKALDDQRKLDQATQDYLDTAADPDASVADLEQSILDLIEAQLDADESTRDLDENVGIAGETMGIVAEQAGVLDEHLGLVDDAIGRLDGRKIDVEFRLKQTGAPFDADFLLPEDVLAPIRHSGGPGRAGEPYRIRPDEEIFVPSGDGEFLLNNEVLDALKGLSSSSSTTTNHFNTTVQSTGDPNTDAQLVGAIDSVRRRMETL